MITKAEFEVMQGLFLRYRSLIYINSTRLERLPNKCDGAHLHALCNLAIVRGHELPFDKLSRWLGFIQGVLAVQGIIDVDEERDFTRPIFHKLYGTEVPTF